MLSPPAPPLFLSSSLTDQPAENRAGRLSRSRASDAPRPLPGEAAATHSGLEKEL